MDTNAAPRDVSADIDLDRLARRLFWAWFALEVVLVLLDGFFNYGRLTDLRPIQRLCNLAREDGIGTWFSALQALLVAAAAWLVRARLRAEGGSGRRVAGWTVIALGFAWLATDDAASIHERIGSAFEKLVASPEGSAVSAGGRLLELFPSYPWQVVVGPVFAALGLFLLVFWARELKGWRERAWVAAGLCCYVVAVGLDFLEGLAGGQDGLVAAFGVRPYTVRHWLKVLEEFLEMFGTTCFLVGQVRHLARQPGVFALRLLAPPPTGPTPDDG